MSRAHSRVGSKNPQEGRSPGTELGRLGLGGDARGRGREERRGVGTRQGLRSARGNGVRQKPAARKVRERSEVAEGRGIKTNDTECTEARGLFTFFAPLFRLPTAYLTLSEEDLCKQGN